MVKKWLFLLIFLSTTLNAQEIKLSTSLSDKEIALGNTTTLTIQTSSTGTTQIPDPEIPDITEDFTILANSFNTTYQILNNRSTTLKIQKITLAPKRSGTLKIPKIVLKTPDKRLETRTLKLTVTEATTPTKTPKAQPKKAKVQTTPTLRLEASTQKTTLYEGEPTIYSLKLYRSVNLWSPPITETPSFKNYWKEDLELSEERFETIDGEKFALMELARTLIIPLSNTSNIIAPARAIVRAPGIGRRALFTSNPIPITLLPLPEPKPDTFKGTVGKFKLTHNLSPQTVTQNTAFSIEITLTGSGNLKSITELTPPETNDFKIYKSNITDKLKTPIQGSRTFEYTIIPQSPGKISLPPFKLHYFSPRTHSYQTLETPPTAIFSAIEESTTPSPGHQTNHLRGPKVAQKPASQGLQITLIALILLNIGLLITHVIKLVRCKIKPQAPTKTALKIALSEIKKLKKQDNTPKQSATKLLNILENFGLKNQVSEPTLSKQLNSLKIKLNEIAYAPNPKKAKLTELITITQKLIIRIARHKT